jgi:polyphosphate kinase
MEDHDWKKKQKKRKEKQIESQMSKIIKPIPLNSNQKFETLLANSNVR